LFFGKKKEERKSFVFEVLSKNVERLRCSCEKFTFAALGGKSKFFRGPFSLILLRKINENGPLKKILFGCMRRQISFGIGLGVV